ncbi:MAG: leucine-rich repeat domain-containing protein [Spirochaetaceae bacterium]|jgi:hypothetical protein|nr:leucine-rich repeat domain-containing protein [Spirochaetaceae bacterium]
MAKILFKTGTPVLLLALIALLSGCGGGKRISDVGKVESYLAQFSGGAKAGEGGAAAEAPAPAELALKVQLSAENWMAILNSLENAGVQVRLDLSDCKRGNLTTGGGLRSDGVFDTNVATEYGRKYIAELILPRTATAIASGKGENSTLFRNFTSLKAVSGENITNIGNLTFSYRKKLKTANFPKAKVIGEWAFLDTGLTNADFPAATSIGEGAFAFCKSLTNANIPKEVKIGTDAFAETPVAGKYR